MFGRRDRAQQQRAGRGADLQAEVSLSFEDSLRGIETQIPVEAEAACRECGGSGTAAARRPRSARSARAAASRSRARACSGSRSRARACGGNGTMIEKPCPRCHGSGRERRTKRYKVKIPAGVKDGTQIRLKGKGEPGYGGGPPGDLIVVTRVAESPLYKRRGADLEVEVPVTFADAALGAEVEVPTPEGRGLAEGAGRLGERKAPAHQGPRRAEAAAAAGEATSSHA